MTSPKKYFQEKADSSGPFSDDVDFQDTVARAELSATTFPQGEAGDCARAWLDASQESLRLVEQGIARRRFSGATNKASSISLRTTKLSRARPFPATSARLKCVQCNSLRDRGKPDLAVRAVADLLAMARMALNGEGYLLHYLVAMAVHRMAVDAAIAVISDPTTGRDLLDELRQLLLASRPKADSLARVFQVEVVYFTQHEIARLAQADDLRQLVDALVERHLLLGSDDSATASSTAQQATWVRQGLLKLFRGHPKPFDAEDTIRLYSSAVATMIGDLHSPWLTRQTDLTKASLAEIDPWPQPLSFINDFSFLLFGEEKEDREVTNREIEVARNALVKIWNPVGKQMLHYVDSFESVRRAYHTGQLQTEISLLLVACRLFRDKENRLPRQLADLVDAKLIESIPYRPVFWPRGAIRPPAAARLVFRHQRGEQRRRLGI